MPDCRLLEDKTDKEATGICLDCPLPACTEHTMKDELLPKHNRAAVSPDLELNVTDPEVSAAIKEYDELKRAVEGEAPEQGGRPKTGHSVTSYGWSLQKTADDLGVSKPAVVKAIQIATAIEEFPELANQSGQAPAGDSRRKPQQVIAPPQFFTYSTNGAWFSPAEITFRREHVLFLLKHLSLLREGSYPPSGKETGYVETGAGIKSRKFKPGAKWETAAGLYSELSTRLEMCGIDGWALEYLHATSPDDHLGANQRISKYLKCDMEEIDRRIHTALSYVASGPDRRWMDTDRKKGKTYKQFRDHR